MNINNKRFIIIIIIITFIVSDGQKQDVAMKT